MDSFLEQLAILASDQHQQNWDTQAHVDAVANLMAQLDLEAQVLVDALSAYSNDNMNFPEITTIHEDIEFEVAILQFEAEEEIDLHNHPDMTGVIYCLKGEVHIEGFNLLQETSSNGKLLIQQVEDVTITTGEIATLTPERSNIHYLKAMEFTELLDVFTPPYSAGDRRSRYRWYQREDTPIEGRTDVYEAWEL